MEKVKRIKEPTNGNSKLTVQEILLKRQGKYKISVETEISSIPSLSLIVMYFFFT